MFIIRCSASRRRDRGQACVRSQSFGLGIEGIRKRQGGTWASVLAIEFDVWRACLGREGSGDGVPHHFFKIYIFYV